MSGQSSDLLKGQYFINNATTVPIESLLGLVSCNPDLAIFNFARVVVRKDYEDMDEVKIISGGASGHEPTYAGFVGKGMLTAAIQGDMYVSPSSLNILRTINELSTERSMGVLAVIANNSGDRLNFGLAVERAANLGIKARLLTVTDDCSTMPKPRDRRGLTGVIIVQKIAGCLAQRGKNVDEIYNYCDEFQKCIHSVMVSIKHCGTVEKGSCYACEYVLPKTNIEIAAGMHGEIGCVQMALTPVENICELIFQEMTSDRSQNQLVFDPNTPVMVIINNLGTATKLEENIFMKEILSYLRNMSVPVIRILMGRFITAIDMRGFILTIVEIKDPLILSLLDEPSTASAWVKPLVLDKTPDILFLESKGKSLNPIELRGPRLSKRQSNTLLLVAQFACDALISCERQLNTMDAEFGDGDTGSRMKLAAVAINGQLPTTNLLYPFAFLLSISNTFESVAAGTVGCLYGILFEAAAKEFMDYDENQTIDGHIWLKALKRAVDALKLYTRSEEGDRTLLDPLCECARIMEDCLNANMGDVESLGMAISAAEETAQKTKAESREYPDPGAHAVGIWLRAVYEGVKLRCE